MDITHHEIDQLRQDWLFSISNLCENIDILEANKKFDLIDYHYNSTGRYYHTFKHIKHMLEMVNEIYDNIIYDIYNFGSIKNHLLLATFFHDVIYDVNSKASVFDSSLLAMSILNNLGVKPNDVFVIQDLIRITYTHEINTQGIECLGYVPKIFQKIFIDADNAILASDRQDYINYANSIKEEYCPPYTLIDFIEGRREFIIKTLGKTSIFFTEYMKKNYEEKARNNLMAELTELETFQTEENHYGSN